MAPASEKGHFKSDCRSRLPVHGRVRGQMGSVSRAAGRFGGRAVRTSDLWDLTDAPDSLSAGNTFAAWKVRRRSFSFAWTPSLLDTVALQPENAPIARRPR